VISRGISHGERETFIELIVDEGEDKISSNTRFNTRVFNDFFFKTDNNLYESKILIEDANGDRISIRRLNKEDRPFGEILKLPLDFILSNFAKKI
jgi:hypothetical protein